VFAQDTPDTIWLAEAGRQVWAILSKDRRIRSRGNELAQLPSAGVAAFVLTSADLTGDQMAAAFRAALPRMLRLLVHHRRPFVARVGRSGDVELVVLPKSD
jgi:hypothetical protein